MNARNARPQGPRRGSLLRQRSAPQARRHEDRGAALVLEVIVGAVVGVLIIGGFTTFWINSNKASERTADRTRQESTAVAVLNRIGRDVQDSARVVSATPTELVLDRFLSPTQVQRTYYAVGDFDPSAASPGLELITKTERVPGTSTDANWKATGTRTVGREVLSATRFDYLARGAAATQSPAADPGKVARVDIAYSATTDKGTVDLKSSAAVNSGNGGSDADLTGTATGNPPRAVADTGSVAKGGTSSIDLLANDTCGNGVSPCPRASLTLYEVVGGVPAGSGITVTVNGSNGTAIVTVPSIYTGPTTFEVTYRIKDAYGESTAVFTVLVTAANAPPTAKDDIVNVIRGASATANLLGNDLNLNTVTATTATGLPAGVSVTFNASNQAVVSVEAGYAGVASGDYFTYTVTNAGGSSSAKAYLNVLDAANDSTSVSPGGLVTVPLGANDLVPATATFALVGTLPDGVKVRIDTNGDAAVEVATTVTQSSTFTYSLSQVLTPATPAVTKNATVSVSVVAKADSVTLRAYPAAPPASVSQSAGSDVLTWTGGTAPYAVYEQVSNTWVQIAVGVADTTLRRTAELDGTKVYRVASNNGSATALGYGENPSVQYPTQVQVTSAQGSDTNADGIADRRGTNSVTWKANPVTTAWQVLDYPSVVGLDRQPAVSRSTQAVVDNPANSCNGSTRCVTQTGLAAGTEHVYRVAEYRSCDPDSPDLATVGRTVGGKAAMCGSYYAYAPSADFDRYDDPAVGKVSAYQAPAAATAPTNLAIGDAAADECYIRPADTTVDRTIRSVSQVADTDANATFSCADNTAKVSWSGTADQGAAATGKFCSYPVNRTRLLCDSRQVQAVGTVAADAVASTGRRFDIAVANRVDNPLGWGSHATSTVALCNPGGCSGVASVTGYSYPNPFTIVDFNMGEDRRPNFNDVYYDPGCFASPCKDGEPRSYMSFRWGTVAGPDISPIVYSFQTVAGTGTSAPFFNGVELPAQPGNKSLDKIEVREATTYMLGVDAYANRGGGAAERIRIARATARTSPPSVAFAQDAPFCRGGDNSHWKYGAAWRNKVVDRSGNDLSSQVTGWRYMVWAGQVNTGGGKGDVQIGRKAAALWGQPSGGGFPANDSGWDANTNVWEYGQFEGFDDTMKKVLLGGNGNDTVIPITGDADTSTAGHLRLETWTAPSKVGYPNFGDLSSFEAGNSPLGYGSAALRARASKIGTEVAGCGGGAANLFNASSPWTAIQGAITRRANPNINAHVSPQVQAWNQTPGY